MSDASAPQNLPKNLTVISGEVPTEMQDIVEEAVRKGLSAVLFAKDANGAFKASEYRGLNCIKTPKAKDMPLEEILNTHLEGATLAALRTAHTYPNTEFVLLDNTPRVCAGNKSNESASR